jgi:uncharacterized protein YacL (UPF0231 family)
MYGLLGKLKLYNIYVPTGNIIVREKLLSLSVEMIILEYFTFYNAPSSKTCDVEQFGTWCIIKSEIFQDDHFNG